MNPLMELKFLKGVDFTEQVSNNLSIEIDLISNEKVGMNYDSPVKASRNFKTAVN